MGNEREVARGAELGEVDHDGDGDGEQPGGPVLGCAGRAWCAGTPTSLMGQAELSSRHGGCGSPPQHLLERTPLRI